MTTRKELAAMLIECEDNGREIQGRDDGGDWHAAFGDWIFQKTQYRLKPEITYYQVWWDGQDERARVDVSSCPFPAPENIVWDVGNKHIHDFEIEQ